MRTSIYRPVFLCSFLAVWVFLSSCSPVDGTAISASGGTTGGSGDSTPVETGPVREIRFFNSAATTGSMGGRAGADALCTAVGIAGCTTSFAFASFSSSDEIRDLPITKNFSSNSSFTNIAGTATFATSFGALIAGASINLAFNPSGGLTWTGSDSSGALAANNCGGFTTTAGNGAYGTGGATDSTYLFTGNDSCNNSRVLYCMCY